jgi:5'-nucleotidase
VTSAGSQGRFITDLELTVDPVSHRVTGSSASQIAVGSARGAIAKNAEVQALVDRYTADAAPLSERVVTSITQDITRHATSAGESALGDLIADAHLAAMSAPTDGGGQIALMNSTGIRTDLLARTGHVTVGDIRDVHPFGNALIALTLTGAQLHELLEQQWIQGRSTLQISRGFSYEWRATASPGARVEMGSMRLNNEPIDPTAHYRIVTNEFLAGGGDGYTVLAAGTDRTRGMLDSEALEKYAAAHSPLMPPAEGRIRRVP